MNDPADGLAIELYLRKMQSGIRDDRLIEEDMEIDADQGMYYRSVGGEFYFDDGRIRRTNENDLTAPVDYTRYKVVSHPAYRAMRCCRGEAEQMISAIAKFKKTKGATTDDRQKVLY